jgi:hydrogenase expression/formation protein HypE
VEIGKVPNELLEKLVFGNITFKRDEVLARPGIGEDTGVMDLGGDLCVVSTDPITGATKGIGTLAIHVSCNDAATRGAEPVGILLTILCPPGTSEEELELIMKEAGSAAEDARVEIIGGHSEITDAVNRIVISTTVIAKLRREEFKKYDDIQVGDNIVLTKWIGLEGTHILATELVGKLKEYLSAEELEEAKNLGRYLSVVKEGLAARAHGVLYMHDVTEGGVYGAIWETGEATGKGVILFEDMLPIKDVTKKLCKALNIDPKKLISSGSMIMVVPEKNTECLINDLENKGIKATIIGVITERDIFARTGDNLDPITSPGSDELYRALNA